MNDAIPFLSHHIIVVQRSSIGCDASLHAFGQMREVQQGCGREVQFCLAPGYECGIRLHAEVSCCGVEAEPAFTLRQ